MTNNNSITSTLLNKLIDLSREESKLPEEVRELANFLEEYVKGKPVEV